MRGVWVLLTLTLAGAALAKPWSGIEPGKSKREDVLKKFGDPARVVKQDGKEIIAYLGKHAIPGTSQAQFRVDPATQLVERIDVFPAAVIERDAVENTYGPACPASGPPPGEPCFIKKVTDDFRTYYVYPTVGLSVFFDAEAKTVRSLTFTPARPGKAP